MKRVFVNLTEVVCLVAALLMAWTVMDVVFAATPEVYAQGLTRFTAKVNDVVQLVQQILAAITVLLVAIVGVKFAQGDPGAPKFAMMSLIGVVIIFGATDLVTWLST